MHRKYFEAFGVMDSENLRSNTFFHSCVIFLYADCDEEENIKLPFYIDDSYSFYSHPLPYKKSFREEPLAFFTQKLGTNFRFRGNFGEWKRENIHDLSLGRGLTGRLFEKDPTQVLKDKASIQDAIKKQDAFLSQASTLIDREELYRNYERQEFLKLIKAGVPEDEAAKKTKGIKPLPEFNSFPLGGGAFTCKTATLGIIASGFDAHNEEHKLILDYINYLRYGSLSDNYINMFERFLTSFIPRRTPDLDELIFHCATNKWEPRGEKSKYPYCDWRNVTERDLFAVTAGGWYVDLKGCMQPLMTLDEECKNVIKNLKVISRICEINIIEVAFKGWHEKINHFLHKFATCTAANTRHIWAVAANDYLNKLISSRLFTEATQNCVPDNLRYLLDKLIEPTPKEVEADNSAPYYSW